MNGIVDFEIPVTQLENLFRNVLGISLDIFNANNNITKTLFISVDVTVLGGPWAWQFSKAKALHGYS